MKTLHCGGMHCDLKTGAVVPRHPISSAQAIARNRKATMRVGSGTMVRVPRRLIEAILSEATNEDADILTHWSWNLEYGVKCTLTVAELRQLNLCLKPQRQTNRHPNNKT